MTDMICHKVYELLMSILMNYDCTTRPILPFITMDDLRFRLNFNLSKNNEIYHHS